MTTVSTPPFKKWGKRAAIGVGAIGVVALGADVLRGGLFDGGDGGLLSGGGDGGMFSEGDEGGGDGGMFGGYGDGDTGGGGESVEANYARLAMEQQGQENSLILLDPPGTTYTMVDDNSLI